MSKTLTISTLQLRNDTALNWTTKNPVLAKAEVGIEIDTNKLKIGNGVSTWGELEYFGGEIIIDTELNGESENPVQNKVVNDAVHYTNETPIIQAIGGIKVGTTFTDVPVTEMLTKILYPYTKPTASIGVAPNGGVYEKGLSVSVTSLKATATKKSSDIASVVVKQGGTTLTTITKSVANGGTFNVLPESGVTLTANTTFSATVTDVDGGSTTANSSAFTFVDPYYYGVVADGAIITSDLVKGLTKDVKVKGSKSYSYTTSGDCMVIAYPASYGELKSALDPNAFENITSFTKHEVAVTCESGEVNYFVYVKTPSTVSDFVMKYSY